MASRVGKNRIATAIQKFSDGKPGTGRSVRVIPGRADGQTQLLELLRIVAPLA